MVIWLFCLYCYYLHVIAIVLSATDSVVSGGSSGFPVDSFIKTLFGSGIQPCLNTHCLIVFGSLHHPSARGALMQFFTRCAISLVVGVMPDNSMYNRNTIARPNATPPVIPSTVCFIWLGTSGLCCFGKSSLVCVLFNVQGVIFSLR